jgi:hypothetical protein
MTADITDEIQPGDLITLAGWPCPIALEVVEIHGDMLIVQAGNVRIQAYRSTVVAVHREAQQVQA